MSQLTKSSKGSTPVAIGIATALISGSASGTERLAFTSQSVVHALPTWMLYDNSIAARHEVDEVQLSSATNMTQSSIKEITGTTTSTGPTRPNYRDELAIVAAVAYPQAESDTANSRTETSNSGNVASNMANELDEVVVTGRFQNSLINRLPLAPAELPFSLHILDRDIITDRGFFKPLDVIQTIPNVIEQNSQPLPGGSTYFVRGFPASTLVNNRPESYAEGAGRRDLSFVERIEVLKGPASVSLGPTRPGGIVNQVTKSPIEGNMMEMVGRVGSFETYRVEVDGNTSSLFGVDALGARLTVAYEDLGLPQDEAYTETLAVRPVVEWDLTDRTRIQSSLGYIERDGIQQFTFPINPDGSVPEFFDNETFVPPPKALKSEDSFFDFELQHEFLNNLRLIARGSHQDSDFDYQYLGVFSDGEFLSASSPLYAYVGTGINKDKAEYYDLQTVGSFTKFNQSQEWVVGVSRLTRDQNVRFSYTEYLTIPLIDYLDGGLSQVQFGDDPETVIVNQDELYSVYGEIALRPTSRLTVLAGVRYDDFEANDLLNASSYSVDDVTSRIGLTYQMLDSLNGYISYAQSFVPQNGLLRSGDRVQPETGTNYEVGLKGALFENRLAITAATFYLARENVATLDPTNTPGERFVVAAGEQIHKGFEFTLNGQFNEAFGVTASYGLLDTEITKSNDGFEGQPAPLVPDHTYSLFGTFTVPSGKFKGLRVGAGIYGVSDRPDPRFDTSYDGFVVGDLSLAFPFSPSFDVQLNVLNVTDERYLVPGFLNGGYTGGIRFGDSRAVYLTVRTRVVGK